MARWASCPLGDHGHVVRLQLLSWEGLDPCEIYVFKYIKLDREIWLPSSFRCSCDRLQIGGWCHHARRAVFVRCPYQARACRESNGLNEAQSSLCFIGTENVRRLLNFPISFSWWNEWCIPYRFALKKCNIFNLHACHGHDIFLGFLSINII